MKSSLLFVLLCILTLPVLAQSGVRFSKDSDTAFWYRYKNNYAERFKLGLIEEDTADYSFRFWSSGMVIKIMFNAGNGAGEIIRFTEAYPRKKRSKIFVKRFPISAKIAVLVQSLVDSLKIEYLPSDKNIVGWQHGFDGIEYFTEFKRNGQYSFKNYWTPTAQDTLSEAMQFQKLVFGLESILDLKTSSKEFQNSIPFDSWSNPGSSVNAVRIKPRPKKKNGS